LCITVAAPPAFAASRVACPDGVDPTASSPLAESSGNNDCKLASSGNYSRPDPKCTPGAVNPTVDLAVLQSGKFKTGCERDSATSSTKKQTTYVSYAIKKPAKNTGKSQTCELDHLISLELGGADTLDNIWPQCGPSGTVLAKRYFKIKDAVENYLAAQVKNGDMSLGDAQHGIATDWTQYIAASTKYWSSHSIRGFGKDETQSQ
jgi:hypothetical protein